MVLTKFLVILWLLPSGSLSITRLNLLHLLLSGQVVFGPEYFPGFGLRERMLLQVDHASRIYYLVIIAASGTRYEQLIIICICVRIQSQH